MPTFADYYRDLLAWEDVPFQPLIETWPSELRHEVEGDIRTAVTASNLKASVCPLRPGSTNQSIGNQVEEFAMTQLAPCCVRLQIESCAGAGYPDKILVRQSSGLLLAFEIKATSDWNPGDSNRRVLTSSSEKIRRSFRPPVYHLLCTLIYTMQGGRARIDALRLDFIEPTTPVNVRLEASVSHKILAQAVHASVVI